MKSCIEFSIVLRDLNKSAVIGRRLKPSASPSIHRTDNLHYKLFYIGRYFVRQRWQGWQHI